jgi:hypothetical protein
VRAIADDRRFFTFTRDCPVPPRVVFGDARLTLAVEPDRRYALLIVDAFSSDAIPVHLLTREAFALYARVLADSGAILVHISNRHLNLRPVVAELARATGFVALIADYRPLPSRAEDEFDYQCDWVLLTRRVEDAGSLAEDERWEPMRPTDRRAMWTDDYSNVVSVIRWNR